MGDMHRRVRLDRLEKAILLYVFLLLTAPMLMMPFAPGTVEFVVAALLCGSILSISGLWTSHQAVQSTGCRAVKDVALWKMKAVLYRP